MLSTPILLDYQSSTPCHKDVVDSMKPFWSEIFSNPASKSNFGGDLRKGYIGSLKRKNRTKFIS